MNHRRVREIGRVRVPNIDKFMRLPNENSVNSALLPSSYIGIEKLKTKMSTEVKKRGRPRKVQVVEETVMPAAEKTPRLNLQGSSPKLAAAVATATSKIDDGSDGIEKVKRGRKKTTETKDAEVKAKPKTTRKRASKPSIEDGQPPPAIAELVAIEESKILEEVSKVQKRTPRTRRPVAQEERAVVEEVSTAEVIPPIKDAPAVAAHFQPTNTLAMGLPIPTHQSTMHTVGLHASHCLPWLPNPSTLTQAAYLSTTTQMHAANKRKLLPSLKEANRFAVKGESSRGGPGSGAANSRAQQVVEDARGSRPELLQPGEMPAKYKPAMRRVQALIVALPIVIVTSWMLYERCECLPSDDR